MSFHEFFTRALETLLVEVSKGGLDDFGMDQLRVDAEDHAILELIPYTGTPETHVQFFNRIGRSDLNATATPIMAAEVAYDFVDVFEAHLDEIEGMFY